MVTTQRKLVYVAGFAGPGQYEEGEDGSPVIALKVVRDHVLKDKLQCTGMNLVFFFIENDDARFQNLNRLLGKLQLPANFKVITECNSFVCAFGDVLTELEQQSQQLVSGFKHFRFKPKRGLPERNLPEGLRKFWLESSSFPHDK